MEFVNASVTWFISRQETDLGVVFGGFISATDSSLCSVWLVCGAVVAVHYITLCLVFISACCVCDNW